MGRPKFIADADFNEPVISALRKIEAGIDFLTAADGGTRGLSDRHVLHLAAAIDRVVVSHDRNTMIGEFYRLLAEGYSSPGLIIVRQGPKIGQTIEDLLLIWAGSEAEELRDRVRWVPLRG